MIKSINYSQHEIIKNIISLHIPSGVIDCDPTYSKGNFYNKTEIQIPNYCSDIESKFDYVKEHSSDDIPVLGKTFNSIMFDPPFLATTGKSLDGDANNNIINKRFGVFKNEYQLHSYYISSLKEFYRILKTDGILIFKCQDKISSSKQYISHNFIINEAEKLGFYTLDIFILLAKNRIVADWQVKNQKNARKFHSYFLVFKKTHKKINYIAPIKDQQLSILK